MWLFFCRYPTLEPEAGKLPKVLKKDNLYWPSISEQWDLLGTNLVSVPRCVHFIDRLSAVFFSQRRALAILVLLTACAEGVVRVLTFQELGRTLVSCAPPLYV